MARFVILLSVLLVQLLFANAIDIGGDCTNDQTGCTPTHSSCVSNACACDSGYTANAGNTECNGNIALDATCTASTQCADPQGTCTDSKCVCGSGFQKNTGGTACEPVPAGQLNGACKPDDVCDVTDTVCTASKCVCKTGYTENTAGTACEKADGAAAGVVASVVMVVSGLMMSSLL